MKKLAAPLKTNWISLRLAMAVGYAVSAVVAFTPIVSTAQACNGDPPPPAPPYGQCDINVACYTITTSAGKPFQTELPKIPCAGNYVCRNTNAQGIGTCVCAFGSLEMPFPNTPNLDVCTFVAGYDTPFAALVSILDRLAVYITATIVALGLIMIIIGGYFYLTAGGDSTRIGTAKKIIVTALLGIMLALMGWLILNTISSQFTQPPDPLAFTKSKPTRTQ